jgi:hypothetical protein
VPRDVGAGGVRSELPSSVELLAPRVCGVWRIFLLPRYQVVFSAWVQLVPPRPPRPPREGAVPDSPVQNKMMRITSSGLKQS